MIKKDNIILAICIALFPPLWAVFAPHIGIQTGAVALICASLYVLSQNNLKSAFPLTIGLLLGDAWAYFAIWFMAKVDLQPDFELFITLAVLGALAVLISALAPKLISCPAWLCGWAIGLTILSPLGYGHIGLVGFQIAAAMVVGIWYVGVFIGLIQKKF